MTNEILEALARVNIAASAIILLVLALRSPVRRLFGARIAYALWIVVLCAPAAEFLPHRSIGGVDIAASHVSPPLQVFQEILAPALNTTPESQMPDLALMLIALWIVGIVGSTGVLITRQFRFWRTLGRLRPMNGAYVSESMSHSPLVANVLNPRIILPADFASKFSDEESVLVLAHEQLHVNYGDLRINMLTAILQCVNWFNPLIHIAAFQLRLDQEIACDADVVAIYPEKRHSYAEAMLKNVLSLADAPVGCSWPSRSAHQLKKRIALLNRVPPTKALRLIGASIVTFVGLAGAYASWAAQPPAKMTVEQINPAAAAREMVWGDPKAAVTVIEYASLTCPHCAFFSSEVFPRIKKTYIDTGKIRFVFRDYPLDTLATVGALIARCAPDENGKKLVEMMFKNLQEWKESPAPLDNLKQYAALTGMSPSDVNSCLQNQTLLTALQGEQEKAVAQYKVNATPTFLIGDERVEGVSHDPDKAYAAFSEIIERQLKKAK